MVMNMNNLKILINVADAGNITRAAEALYITQPAVSKVVKSVEDELGVRIFYRNKKSGMSLTDTGEKIIRYARQMLETEEQIYQTAYLARNMLEGTVKIASLPSGTDYFLTEAYAAFHERYPDVNVEIEEGNAFEVAGKVAEHRVDFGISFVPGSEFESRLLMKDEIIAFSKQRLPAGEVDLIHMKARFYSCTSAWQSIQPRLEDLHMKDFSQFQIINSSAVRSMAEKGLGIGLQGRSIVPENYSGCHVYPVRPEIRTDLALIARSFKEMTPAAARFAEFIRPVL